MELGEHGQDEQPVADCDCRRCAIAARNRLQKIDKMVDRFLCWRLPDAFGPDAGIAFTPPKNPDWWPVGTNLLTAEQAKAMFEHCMGTDDA